MKNDQKVIAVIAVAGILLLFGIGSYVANESRKFKESGARVAEQREAREDAKKDAPPKPSAYNIALRQTLTGIEVTNKETDTLKSCKVEINYGDGWEARKTFPPNEPVLIPWGEFTKDSERFNPDTHKVEKVMVNLCEGRESTFSEFRPQ